MMESMFKQATSGDVEDFKQLQMECTTPSANLEPTLVLNEAHKSKMPAYTSSGSFGTGIQWQPFVSHT